MNLQLVWHSIEYVLIGNVKMKIITKFLLFTLTLAPLISWAQGDTSYQEKYAMAYEQRILQTHINGFYIPIDVTDAMKELHRIVDPHGKLRFKVQDEQTAVRKIHFSFGRWMIHNWGFYEGSRLSHYLKGLGITYPDDMATTLMICFHRSLNEKQLELETLAKAFAEERRKEVEERLRQGQILEVNKVEKN